MTGFKRYALLQCTRDRQPIGLTVRVSKQAWSGSATTD